MVQSTLSQFEALCLAQKALDLGERCSIEDYLLDFVKSVGNYILQNRYSEKQIQGLRNIIDYCERTEHFYDNLDPFEDQ